MNNNKYLLRFLPKTSGNNRHPYLLYYFIHLLLRFVYVCNNTFYDLILEFKDILGGKFPLQHAAPELLVCMRMDHLNMHTKAVLLRLYGTRNNILGAKSRCYCSYISHFLTYIAHSIVSDNRKLFELH